jgi:glycosyltransferase involved in cell wall biosynthesis
MTSLLGYLGGWRDIGSRIHLTVYASRPQVLDAVAALRPDVELVPFAFSQPSHKHFLLQQTVLGRQIERSGADVVFGSQCRVANCRLPQVVHHENVLRFLHPGALGGLTRGPAAFIKDKFARHSLRHATRNVFNSAYIRGMAETIAPETRSRNGVIHLGVTRELVQKARTLRLAWHRQPTLVAIQSTAAHKDNPTLLRTLRQLVDLAPGEDWQLQVAGTGDWSRERAFAAELDIAHRVHFLGYVGQTELSNLMSQAACLVMTSRLESFGLPLIEAMANGCPVVSSAATALPEVVGNAGLLIEPGQPKLFARAILQLYYSDALRQELVELGAERVQSFQWTHAASRLAEVLHDAADHAVENAPELVAAA